MTALSKADQLRARFDLAIGYANRALTPGADRKGDLARADNEARKLLAALLGHQRDGQLDRRGPLRTMADGLRPVVLMLLAGVWAQEPGLSSAPDAEGVHKKLKALLGDYPDRSPARLIALSEKDAPWRSSPRLAYGYACHCATASPPLHDNALEALTVAIGAPLYRAWAPKDPWLTPLQEGRPREWAELFPPEKPVSSPPAVPDLAVLGLREVPVTRNRLNRSDEIVFLRGQAGWQDHSAVLEFRAMNPAAAASPWTCEITEGSGGTVRALHITVGGLEAWAPFTEGQAAGALPGRPSTWDDLRLSLVVGV